MKIGNLDTFAKVDLTYLNSSLIYFSLSIVFTPKIWKTNNFNLTTNIS